MKGFNFRLSSGYVTDGTDQTYVLPTDAYPVTRNGVTFGWDVAPGAGFAADRSTGVDVRLAGVAFQNGVNTKFRVDLPDTGQYVTHLAVGDVSGGGLGTQVVEVLDNATSRFSLTGRTYNVANQFYDATDVARTEATWPGNEVGHTDHFDSVIHNTYITDTSYWVIAHLSITKIESPAIALPNNYLRKNARLGERYR